MKVITKKVRIAATVSAISLLMSSYGNMIAAKEPSPGREETTNVQHPPGVIINHFPGNSEKYIGSPNICILPNGDYVASHDEFGTKSNEWRAAVTRIFSSSDQGATRKEISEIREDACQRQRDDT